MSFTFFSHIISSFLILLFGFLVLLKNKQSKTNLSLFVLCLSIFLWLFTYSLVTISKTEREIIFWLKICYASIVFIPSGFYCFNYLMMKEITGKRQKFILSFNWSVSFLFAGLILFSDKFLHDFYKYPWGYYAKPALFWHPLFLIFSTLLFASPIVMLSLQIWNGKNNLSSIQRAKFKYVFLGSLLGSFGSVDFLPNYGINIYPFGFIFMIIFPLIYGYAIVKYRLMDIRIFISHTTAFLVSYTFLLGVPFFFAYRMYPVLYPIWGRHWWLAPVGLMTFFATIAPLAYDQIRRGVEERFLAEQKRYQKLLLQAASGMAREHNLSRLSKLIVCILKRIVKIDFAAIFLDDKEHKTYRLKAVRDSGASGYTLEFSYDSAFIKLLKNNKEPYLYEELPLSVRSALAFPKRVSLIIPSLIEENLLGFVVLGEKNNRESYSGDDINVFKILTNQAAMTIENCLFFEEFKNAQEKIFNAEKLASIGGMADGVAHQIKNRLNHFSIASGELKCEIEDFRAKHKEFVEQNPDLEKTFKYSLEIADSLIKNVKMTDGIVRGILTYARVEEKETFFSHFSFREVLDASLELLKIKHELQEFPLEINLDNCDMIYGVKAQIMESMYNILDNAYEASIEKKHYLTEADKEKFTPLIKLKLTKGSANYRIEISDNGVGIKDEAKQKIFAPFFTTKSSYKSGTGIGMYVVKRIVVENHKGRIWFESAYMQGTKFIIELPKK